MDYTKQCWNCGNMAMAPRGSFYLCLGCGATWNEQPELKTYDGIGVEKGATGGGTKFLPKRRRGNVVGGPPHKQQLKF